MEIAEGENTQIIKKKTPKSKIRWDIQYQIKRYATDDDFKQMKKDISKKYYETHKQELAKKALDRYYNNKNKNKSIEN